MIVHRLVGVATRRSEAVGAVGGAAARWQSSAGTPWSCRAVSTSIVRRDAGLPTPAQGRKVGGEAALPESLWTCFVRWSYAKFGNTLYPPKADICNCGVDMGVVVPRPELVLREGIEQGSTEWRMQLYGAALYWHVATTPGEKATDVNPDMLRGKDVLEVACMRGGGARYLATVAGPRSYVATDNVEDHIRTEHAVADGSDRPQNLRFERADALTLDSSYPAESFDFVICIQAAASFSDARAFVRGAKWVLRPGGSLLMCDAMGRATLQHFLEAFDEERMSLEACSDLSRAVHAVGLCPIPGGISYLRLVARKEDVPLSSADGGSPAS